MIEYDKIQDAIVYATQAFSGVESHKPTLLHSIRCGIKLLDNGYSTDMIIAGVLHDTIEDTPVTLQDITSRYGSKVAELVAANTKDPTIEDKNVRREELVKRACKSSAEAATIKLADIADNYEYYTAIHDESLINYCRELKGYFVKYIDTTIIDTYMRVLLDKII